MDARGQQHRVLDFLLGLVQIHVVLAGGHTLAHFAPGAQVSHLQSQVGRHLLTELGGVVGVGGH